MLTLTIDGQTVQAAPGATVLEAARQNGIEIPSLCHHPQLRAVGACRLCVVEIEGMRGFPTSCTTPAAEGMVVHTLSPALQELRREILSLILSEHPYTCLVCERHERCAAWQITIRKAGATTGCENCPKNGQCDLQNLADQLELCDIPYPITYRGLPVEKSDPFFDRDYNLCILCGRCVRVCQDVRHTGTLSFVERGPKTLVGTAFGQSHLEADCEFCGSCVDVCPTGALYDKRTKWEGVPDATAKTVCPYCSVGCELTLWLKNGRLIGVRPSLEGHANHGQACARGRFGLVEIVHSPDRLRTPLIRKNGQLVEASWDEAFSYTAARLSGYHGEAFALLGSPHLTNQAAYIFRKFAQQVANTANIDCATALPRHDQRNELRHWLLHVRRASLDALRQAGSILVIGANPRLSHPILGLYIRQATRRAQGERARLVVLDPRRTELARRADLWLQVQPGQDAVILQEMKQALVERATDGSATAEAARLLRQHGPAVIVYGSGVMDYPAALETLQAIQSLVEFLPGAGVLPLVGAANTLGTLALGLAAGDGSRNYDQILAGIQAGEIKALYLAGEAPPLEALGKLEFLVVQEALPTSNLYDYAHVVFPAASFAETSGAYINLEGRSQSFAAAIPLQGQARPDWWITARLAQAMGAAGFEYASTAEIEAECRAEVSAATAEEVQPALPQSERPGSSIVSSSFPLMLLLERSQFAYRGASLVERIKGMAQVKTDEELVSLHPDDAASLGVANGELARLVSPYGADTFLVRLTADILPGTAYASINPADGSELFPSRLPGQKAYAVRVEKV